MFKGVTFEDLITGHTSN